MMAIGAFPNWWRQMPKKRPRGGGGPTTPPTPPAAVGIVGYARVWFLANGKSAGSLSVDNPELPAADATIYNVTTGAQFRTALLASGKRFINIIGSLTIDLADLAFNVTHGDVTVYGGQYTGPGTKGGKVVFKVGNVILMEMAFRPGEGSTVSASADRRAFSFNPGNDGTVIHGIAIIHCSGSWGPDVVGSFINNTEDATVQQSMLGPALLQSNLEPSPGNGYGFNVTTPGNSDPTTIYTKRLTFYRNLHPFCKQRNLKAEHTLGVDWVNEVVYGYGNQDPVRGNFRGGNVVSCILKKGPDTQTSNSGFEQDGNYAQYPASTYHDGNIGITAAGGSFTPTWGNISGAALRATPYDGGPTDAAHGALTVATADGTLFTAVVAGAGRTFQDPTDTSVKAHAVAGTGLGGNGYYNGAGFSAPHPSWP